MQRFGILKQVVYIVTTGIERVNRMVRPWGGWGGIVKYTGAGNVRSFGGEYPMDASVQ
jgi:hypothetical protein